MTPERVVIGDAELWHGDCREVLPLLPKVDAVITDPPYSERTHVGHDASARGHLGAGKDGAERKPLGYGFLTEADVEAFAAQFTAATDGWVVWMCDHVLAPEIAKHLERNGRYVFAPLPYFAPGSRVRLSGDGPSSWTVWMVVARTPALSRWGTLPGGYLADTGWREREHMGGKPTALMARIVSDYSRRAATILDPFMGSGTTGIACMSLGRRFIGIEIERRYFDIAARRIEDAQRQGRMFA